MDFDVIVVGGRPAGATLAARLGQAGLRVALLERDRFPAPHPASSPAIYAGTMAMLDEIGADEARYAAGTPRITAWVIEAPGAFVNRTPIPAAFGRTYGYAIDRARFDAHLWDVAAASPGVTALPGFAVSDLLREGERVVGVRGRGPDGAIRELRADLVVGADGRFSLVARRAGAAERLKRNDHPTSLLYAYWSGAEAFDSHGPVIHTVVGKEPGAGYLLMDSADGSLAVVIEGRSDHMEPASGESAEAFYLRRLRRIPAIWRRLDHARMATPVRGMKRVGNFYRTAGGPGWALAGDALHQKDPLDGQGIYDAVFTARALATEVLAWKRGEAPWADALRRYDRAVLTETMPMYFQTINSVRQMVYGGAIPAWSLHSLVRWILTDPQLRRANGRMIVRDLPADEARPRWRDLIAAVWRGLQRDLARDLARAIQPTGQPAASTKATVASNDASTRA